MKILAIATCRVSTPEQRQSGSLTRQEESVMKAAEHLEATIPSDGWWSGSVSSKAGTNVNRKDLQEMLTYCKANKGVKYLIVDEPDRFMRSIDEAAYYEVLFRQLGVQVWYASDPALNTGDLASKLLKFSKYFSSEGSNEERQQKSIRGHQKAIREGRYTFAAKPGYKKGIRPGVHVLHPTQSEPFRKALKSIAARTATPLEALSELNDSLFLADRTKMKSDKFYKAIVDPYYCGIIEVGKQIQTRCENGLHEPMITLEEHLAIVEVVTGRTKRQFTKKQFNPEFPLNRLLTHDCEEHSKFTGSFHKNGHGNSYPKYRCRSCGKQYSRDPLHDSLSDLLKATDHDPDQEKELINAMEEVWTKKQQDNIARMRSLELSRQRLVDDKSSLVREYARSSGQLKLDLEAEVTATNKQIKRLDDQLDKVRKDQGGVVEFIKFGLGYAGMLKDDWWQLTPEERALCQQMLFPALIHINSSGKVGTTPVSPIYGLLTNNKDLPNTRKASMVELRGVKPLASAMRMRRSIN